MKIQFFLYAFILNGLFTGLSAAALSLSPDRTNVPEIMIGHYLVASSVEYPALQTSGVGPCIVVTLYDQYSQQGAMLHVSAPVDIKQAIQQIVGDFERRGSHASQIAAQLLGGWDDSLGAMDGMHYESERMVNQLLSELAWHQVRVVRNTTLTKLSDLKNGAVLILDLELDLQTGEVYRYLPSVPFADGAVSYPMPTAFLQYAPL